MFMRFDHVRYTGSKLGELKNKTGEVIVRIPTGGYVVDFGNVAYIISEENLGRPLVQGDTGPEVVRRAKKWDVEPETPSDK